VYIPIQHGAINQGFSGLGQALRIVAGWANFFA
jgi:hypothetical protein